MASSVYIYFPNIIGKKYVLFRLGYSCIVTFSINLKTHMPFQSSRLF